MTRSEETIFAPATGFGKAAIAIIRVSGPQVRAVLEGMAGGVPKPRRAVLRSLRNDQGEVLDRAIVLFFPGPRSETGEDMCEFHVHGGRAVVGALMEALRRFDRCRPAQPGEFAQRAFFNGKKDLLDLESLADLIDAETELQRVQAVEGGGSLLRGKTERWRSLVLDVRADIEASLDFSDETDVTERLDSKAKQLLSRLYREIREVLVAAERGERVRQGYKVCLCGAPNAGKSSLLNAIAQRDVAIVSEVPGTTRDRLDVALDLGGVPVVIYDTAGFRETYDPVESLGIERSVRAVAESDLILWLREPGGPSIGSEFPIGHRNIWVIGTKADLGDVVDARLQLSATTGAGIAALVDAIQHEAKDALTGEPAVLTRLRHKVVLEGVSDALGRAIATEEPELIAEELRVAEASLDRLIGRIDVDEVLGSIFSRFCIGK